MFKSKEEKDIGYGPGHFSPSASQLECYSEEIRKESTKRYKSQFMKEE